MMEMLKNKGIIAFIFTLVLITYFCASKTKQLESEDLEASYVMMNEQIK